MEIFKNLIILISYAIVSLAVALLLPAFAGVAQLESALAGFAVFICAVELHGLYNRRIGRAAIDNELFEIHQDQEQTVRELKRLGEDLSELSEHINEGSGNQSEKVLAEMKVLESLLAQLASKSQKKALQAAGIVSVDGDSLEDDEILEIMHAALRDNRVDLHLQPVVSLPQRKLRFYEAFSRVRDELNRIIYPRHFLRVAQESGLIGTLDNLLLFRCIQVLRQLEKRQPKIGFFCNISAASLRDPDFFPQFFEYMKENGDLAQRLIFEFRQSDLEGVDDDFGAGLEALGALGYQFSMDNVEHLNFDLPDLASKNFKFVKIPAKLFIAGSGDIHPADLKEALNRYLVDLVVDHIEDEDVLIEVLERNVDFGQGYLFGEPRPSRLELEAPSETGTNG